MSGPLGRGQWQLLLFGGKGGVGKTTCAAAAAVALAQESPDQRFVLVSTDPAHSTRHVLADARLPNLTVREIDAAESLRRFKQKHTEQLEKIALRGTILDPEEVQALLDLSLPGLDEIMAFLEISRLVENGEYRCVLVDTAPMGHTLRFLGLFELMERWFQALDAMLAKHRYLSEVYRGEYQPDEVDKFLEQLHQSLTVLATLLRDEQRCRFVAVLLPEELSLLQTRRLLDGLAALHISVTDLIVNQVFSPGQAPKENSHPYQESPSCPICGDTRARQAAVTWQIAARFCEQVLWQAPLWPGEVRGPETLARFWKALTPLVVAPTRTFTGPAPTILVECPAPLPAPEVRLLLLAGKGGVGKSTLACATALRLAETYPDQRVLLFSTDPAHSLSGCLNRSIGPGETEICPGLWAVEIDAAAELVELKTRYAREVARFFEKLGGQDSLSLEFDAPVFERVMDLAPPGLDEMMALVRVVKLLQTRGSDRFVLDTAPSGHLVRLLETPRTDRGLAQGCLWPVAEVPECLALASDERLACGVVAGAQGPPSPPN